MKNDWVYLNGEFVRRDEARISPFDRGFLFAHAAYEVTAVYDGKLIDFEGDVDHTNEKYEQLVEEIKAADLSQELPLEVKGHIEDLVEAIKNPGEIGNKLKLIDNLFRGNSGFTKGKTLLEMFVDAVDNDCSKILPLANKLIAVIKAAQRLQYFYEINQQLVKPNDDKGYPKMIYDMYIKSMKEYKKCTLNAVFYAQKVRY